VRPHVLRQGSLDRRGIRTESAFEGFLAGVLSNVSRQRPLLAAGIWTKLTFEGFFPGVDPHVLR